MLHRPLYMGFTQHSSLIVAKKFVFWTYFLKVAFLFSGLSFFHCSSMFAGDCCSLEDEVRESVLEMGGLLAKVSGGASGGNAQQPGQRTAVQQEADTVVQPLMDFLDGRWVHVTWCVNRSLEVTGLNSYLQSLSLRLRIKRSVLLVNCLLGQVISFSCSLMHLSVIIIEYVFLEAVGPFIQSILNTHTYNNGVSNLNKIIF